MPPAEPWWEKSGTVGLARHLRLVRLKHKLGHDDFPGVAPDGVAKLGVGVMAAPADDGAHEAMRQCMPGGGLKLLARRPTALPFPSSSSQRPRSVMRVPSWLPGASAAMASWIGSRSPRRPAKPQVHVLERGPHVAVQELGRCGR